MRKWLAAGLVFSLLGLTALFANPQGQSWVRCIVAEQVAGMLDDVAFTPGQRAALTEVKQALISGLDSKVAQLGALLRGFRSLASSDCEMRRRYHVVSFPGEDPIWIADPSGDRLPAEDASAPTPPFVKSYRWVAGLSAPLPSPSMVASRPRKRDCREAQIRGALHAPTVCVGLDCVRVTRTAHRG